MVARLARRIGLLCLMAAWLLACLASAQAGDRFIQQFLCYQSHGPRLMPGDEAKLARYALLDVSRFRYNEINGDTYGAVRALNSDIGIFIYQQGPDVWRGWSS